MVRKELRYAVILDHGVCSNDFLLVVLSKSNNSLEMIDSTSGSLDTSPRIVIAAVIATVVVLRLCLNRNNESSGYVDTYAPTNAEAGDFAPDGISAAPQTVSSQMQIIPVDNRVGSSSLPISSTTEMSAHQVFQCGTHEDQQNPRRTRGPSKPREAECRGRPKQGEAQQRPATDS